MSKKKNSSKKHKFKHVEGSSAPVGQSTQQPTAVSEMAASKSASDAKGSPVSASPVAVGRDFSYVNEEIRRISVLAGGLIIVEILFYYLMVFTSVGDTVRSWVAV